MPRSGAIPSLTNGQPLPLAEVPLLSLDDFTQQIATAVGGGSLLSALFGRPVNSTGLRLYGVTSKPTRGTISVVATDVGDRYSAITPHCSQAHWFEREIAEQWGVVPEEHPWLKPIRFVRSYRPGKDAWGRSPQEKILPCVQPASTAYFRVEGNEIHEVAVGPIHAGVIEPGHFRFQCHGEHVFSLEISLGYQHRGVERALIGGPNKRSLHYMETIAGDTTIGHTTVYCQTLEGLAGQEPSIRAQSLRGIALELERLANHTGDLGALAQDVGFLPTSAYCGRLRGDFLNASAAICGNRFGRSMVVPGGVGWDVEPSRAEQLIPKLEAALRDVAGAAKLLWQTPTVLARFEETGSVGFDVCGALGLVGPAARACGEDRDVRRDFPTGIYRFAQLPVATWHDGDVFARAYVRWLEIERSGKFVLDQLRTLPAGTTRVKLGSLQPNSLIVTMVEGWRGEVCHVAQTGDDGRFAHYKVIDPSFHNWVGLMMALRDQQISDFPLCNKSFNLSYCGHDL